MAIYGVEPKEEDLRGDDEGRVSFPSHLYVYVVKNDTGFLDLP